MFPKYEILSNRFFEDVKIGDSNNLSKLLGFCLEEARHGYNAVELQQKEKQMQNPKKQEKDEDASLHIFEAFCTSQMVHDRLTKKGDKTGSGK